MQVEDCVTSEQRYPEASAGDHWRYIDIPKTASMAIREALGNTHRDTMHWPAGAFPEAKHLFAVVRDPLDRLVSCFSQMFAMKRSRDVEFFRQWVEDDLYWNECTLQRTPRTVDAMKNMEGVWFALPQVCWLDDRVDLLAFEQLPENVYSWCASHGVPCGPIRRINQSDRLATHHYYDGATESKVRNLYAADFCMLERLNNG